MLRLFKRSLAVVAITVMLAACGGGGGSTSGGGGGSGGSGGGGGGGGSGGPPPTPLTQASAARLLTQATFGPSETSIQQAVSAGSAEAWINQQIAMPMSSLSHQGYIDAVEAASGEVTTRNFYDTWWRQTIGGQDQLRQRVTFALSQIFVISLNDPVIDVRGAASYYDMLSRNAFGNFRTLLEDVTMHPMMGRYLTFLANQKEDPAGTRTPDENYAREVMQLMTIGLVELNQDGTQRLQGGQPIPTYTPADIAGLAKVFTGLSWYHPAPTNTTFFGGNANADAEVRPMSFYPNYHSTSEKTFLGTTIPANATVNIGGDIDIALDRLFNHANTGPFISYRLIQRLVTSNPSPAYVGRVAGVFANNGSGVRGDMGAVVRAILTDTEARDMAAAQGSPTFGKLREPVIRIANWARAFNATSVSGNYLMPPTTSSETLNQAPLSSPSVFNFWRPGFTPPATTQLGQRSLVAPEFQLVDEVTAASYIDFMTYIIPAGPPPVDYGTPDIDPEYGKEMALAGDPAALVERLNTLLFYGQMSSTLRGRLVAAVTQVQYPTSSPELIQIWSYNRTRTAILLAMISPEYLVQR